MNGSGGRVILVGTGRGGAKLLTLHAGRVRDAEAVHSVQPIFDWSDQQLLDAYHSGFPICERPFEEIASRLRCRGRDVQRRFESLERRGVMRRIGPVFAPGCIVATTLAAMAVPRPRLESVAKWVNRYEAVSRTCEREHEFNLWFALSAPNEGGLYETLADIRRRTGLEVLDLRLERVYDSEPDCPLRPQPLSRRRTAVKGAYSQGQRPRLDAADRRLVNAIQDGLSLTARPYAEVADRIESTEAKVMERLRSLLCEGVISRVGVIVCRRQPGDPADAMVVFDVPRARVDMVGARLAGIEPITACCRRTRRLPAWSSNLYCMFHGRDRAEVTGWVDELLPDEVADLPRTVLFTRRRFRPLDDSCATDLASHESGRSSVWLHRGNQSGATEVEVPAI